MNTAQTKQSWPLAGSLLLILLVFTLVLYRHTVQYLVSIWNQLEIGEYAHGYLVLAICAYLIVSQREKLSALTPCPEYRALLIVAGASLLWLLSALVDVEMLQALSLLLLIFAMVWSVLGNQLIQLLAFPILFIIFAIPVWLPLSPLLQNITADVVFSAIRLLSIPAFRQDNMILLPAGTLSIEEACSGLRYLLAALTLGTLYAYMNYSRLRSRLTVVLVAAGAAVLANMLRVFIVVYLGYTTDMQHPLVDDHLSLGWYLFAALTVILLFADAWLSKRPQPTPSKNLFDSNNLPTKTPKANYQQYLPLAVITGLLITAAPTAVQLVSRQAANAAESTAPQLPQEAGDWILVPGNIGDWTPDYHGAVNQQRTYQNAGSRLELYLGYYAVQKQGKELINELNHIGTRNKWRSLYPMPRLQHIGDRQVLEQMLENGAKNQRLVWYWYNVAGTVTTSKYEAKLLQLPGLLSGKPWGFIMAVAADKNDDVDFTRQLMKDFIHSIEIPMNNEITQITAAD